MIDLILILHTVVCLGLIGFVLIQQGKGSEMGAALGAGASQSLFGAQGSANFLSRTTAILATCFFVTCLALTMLVNKQAARSSLVGQITESSSVSEPSEPLPVVPLNGAEQDSTLPLVPR